MWWFFNPIGSGLWDALTGVLRGLSGFAGVALYVLRSIGLYRMALNTGVAYPWFAWIPFLHEYQCAKIGDRARKSQNKTVFLVNLFWAAAAFFLLLTVFRPLFWKVFIFGLLYRLIYYCGALAFLAAAVLADYWLYMDYEPSMSALCTVLSVFRLDGIPKFFFRNNVPVGAAGVCSPKQPKYTR